jgi:lipopolysaccharide export system permease protein
MRLLDRYLLGLTLRPLAVSLVVVLVVLLLERVLRLFSLLVDRRGPIGLVLEMAANLVPHYLGLALPAAFFLSILLVTSRLSADNELDAMNGSGVSLARLAAPFFALAVVLVGLGVFLYGFAQPYSRYSYRAVLHAVTSGVWDATLKPGIVISREDKLMITADQVDASGRNLVGVFIHHRKDNETVTTTARYGRLGVSADGHRLLLGLRDGVQLRSVLAPASAEARTVVTTFSELMLDREFRFEALPFRIRGANEREMTLSELWSERAHSSGEVPRTRLDSEWHGRLARIVSPLLLPLVAVPLGLAARRSHRNYGVLLAIVLLVLFHHAVQLGEGLADNGQVPAPLGIWAPVLLFATFGIWLFRRTAERVGESGASRALEAVESLLRGAARLIRPRWRAEHRA